MFKVKISAHDYNWWQRADRKLFPADLDIPFAIPGLAEVFSNMCGDHCTVRFDNFDKDTKTVDIEITYRDPERELLVILSEDFGQHAVDNAGK